MWHSDSRQTFFIRTFFILGTFQLLYINIKWSWAMKENRVCWKGGNGILVGPIFLQFFFLNCMQNFKHASKNSKKLILIFLSYILMCVIFYGKLVRNFIFFLVQIELLSNVSNHNIITHHFNLTIYLQHMF